MFRVGKVVAVDPKTAKARVEIEDIDKVITYWLPVIMPKTQDDKFYWLPDIGELVLIGFLDYGIEQGFILGSIYNEKDTPPVSDQNKMHIKFKDGTVIEYDRANNTLLIDVKGSITIKASGNVNISSGTQMTLQAPRIDLNP